MVRTPGAHRRLALPDVPDFGPHQHHGLLRPGPCWQPPWRTSSSATGGGRAITPALRGWSFCDALSQRESLAADLA